MEVFCCYDKFCENVKSIFAKTNKDICALNKFSSTPAFELGMQTHADMQPTKYANGYLYFS